MANAADSVRLMQPCDSQEKRKEKKRKENNLTQLMAESIWLWQINFYIPVESCQVSSFSSVVCLSAST
jgi:hypothetical protein